MTDEGDNDLISKLIHRLSLGMMCKLPERSGWCSNLTAGRQLSRDPSKRGEFIKISEGIQKLQAVT